MQNTIINLDKMNITNVIGYSYRTARVFNSFLKISRNSVEGREIETTLSEMSGMTQDNHTVYSVQLIGDKYIHFWCTDLKIIVGLDIEHSMY